MEKTKIDWADSSFNPITGCLHGCPYCYARNIATRFAGGGYGKQAGMFIAKFKDDAFMPPYELDEPQYAKTKNDWYREATYPFGFAPTLHRYRLNDYKNKAGRNIFVCSMSDLYGSWVPLKWIIDVMDACIAAPQHNYMFLTKNPVRYKDLQKMAILPQTSNFWYGTTLTNSKDFGNRGYDLYDSFLGSPCKTFLSLEPLHERIDAKRITNLQYVNWVIVGAESGTRKERIVPEPSWISDIVDVCRTHKIPLFMKSSLIPIVGEENLIQEFPAEIRKIRQVN